uniref:Ovate family protein n=1 Tax=Elaeophora elaphi TaxID=1147741 RepID=A0A0R3S550_9BILA
MQVIENSEGLTTKKEDISNSIETLSLISEGDTSNIQSETQAQVGQTSGQLSVPRCPSISVSWPDDMQMNEINGRNISGDGDDEQLELSFIMKEKLHAFTDNMRRRTSQMIDEIIGESDDEEKCMENVEVARKEHRPSLMSLIGLQVSSSINYFEI